jgi:phage-related protein
MMLEMRTIEYYETESGHCPVEEYLLSLTTKQFEKALWVLRVIEEFDRVPAEYFKKLQGTENLWEVRIQFGNDIFRLLGFFDAGKLIILTNGFSKKTQKTPAREIHLAEQRMRDHLKRKGK